MITEHTIKNAWLSLWELARSYHRYSVKDFDVLRGGESALIAGYHGRPFAADMCILTTEIHRELGYLPACVLHKDLHKLPGAKTVIDALGFITSKDDPKIEEAIERKEHIVVTPGGAYEGMRSYHDNYRVEWPDKGYLKLAAQHKLKIIPVACAGADEAFYGLLDGEEIVKRLGCDRRWAWAPWTGVGIGLYPFALPIPVRFYQKIGEPIDIGELDPDDEHAVEQMHQKVTSVVQQLLEKALEEKREQ